jgi:hypothetical protein
MAGPPAKVHCKGECKSEATAKQRSVNYRRGVIAAVIEEIVRDAGTNAWATRLVNNYCCVIVNSVVAVE